MNRSKMIKSNNLWNSPRALAIGLVCLTAINAGAQVSSAIRPDGAVVSTTTPKANTTIPDSHPSIEEALPSGVAVIYSNFGTGASLYDSGTGWTEAGEEANDYPIAQGLSFVPDSDYVLLRVDAAFTYVQGTNGIKLIIAADNGGVPGKVIFGAAFNNLPEFGTCCTVQTAKLTPTTTRYVGLKGGQTYWIYPLPADTTSYLVWNFDTTGKGGTGSLSQRLRKDLDTDNFPHVRGRGPVRNQSDQVTPSPGWAHVRAHLVPLASQYAIAFNRKLCGKLYLSTLR